MLFAFTWLVVLITSRTAVQFSRLTLPKLLLNPKLLQMKPPNWILAVKIKPSLTRMGLLNVKLMAVLTSVMGLATLTTTVTACLRSVSEPEGSSLRSLKSVSL